MARFTGSGSDGQTLTILPKSGSFSTNSGKPDGKTGFEDDVMSESEMVCRECVSVFETGTFGHSVTSPSDLITRHLRS